MVTAVVIFILFILYTLACIADGPDVKPLWKKWLGKKLADIADGYYPIDFCIVEKCKFWRLATASRPKFDEPINILQTTFDAVMIEENICISEWEIMRAMHETKIAREHGMSHLLPKIFDVDYIIENAKRNCVKSIEKTIEDNNLISIEVDRESLWPRILVRGYLNVGRRRV